MTCSRPVQSTGPVNQQIDHLGACINDHNLDLVVSACSDASEDGEDELKEEGVGHQGGVKNPKVGKEKMDKQIIHHVTAPMSEQFSESRSDRQFFAKFALPILQKTVSISQNQGEGILQKRAQIS